MARARVLVLRAAGTNCDHETVFAWQAAGAEAERVHIRRLIEAPAMLDDYQIVTIPGGFSYGDDIAAGRIFAAQLRRHLLDQLRRLVERGGLVLGICNGFQVLVRCGLLGSNGASDPCCTITGNDRGYQDRWVRLRCVTDQCAFLEADREYELPIAHGEGRVVFSGSDVVERVRRDRLDALRYVPSATNGEAAGELYNPNGSEADVAGLCDETGRILGLMPHPERFVTWTQHPNWTSRDAPEECDGMAIFRRAVTVCRD